MKPSRRSSHELISLCTRILPALACAILAASSAGATESATGDAPVPAAHAGHEQHSAQGHDQDQHEHAQDDAQGGADDPHAHHRAMMNQKGYKRSEHQYRLEDLELTAMDGSETSLFAELDSGKPVMINFIFTTCTTICPVMSATFAQVQGELGPDAENVRMISVSIDPEYDTPGRLRAYASLFHAGDQWQFLTGKLDNVIAVQKAFDVYRGNKMNHEPTTLLRRSPGDSWVRLDGIASAAEIVAEDRDLLSN